MLRHSVKDGSLSRGFQSFFFDPFLHTTDLNYQMKRAHWWECMEEEGVKEGFMLKGNFGQGLIFTQALLKFSCLILSPNIAMHRMHCVLNALICLM